MVNCTTLQPLPDDQQEAPYNAPNVRLPRGLGVGGATAGLIGAFEHMWNTTINRGIMVAQMNKTTCTDPTDSHRVNATDCIETLADVYDRGGEPVPHGVAGRWVGVSVSCPHIDKVTGYVLMFFAIQRRPTVLVSYMWRMTKTGTPTVACRCLKWRLQERRSSSRVMTTAP